ncbi:MAG: ribonuclease HII [bacterium]|nr:ribonuclease HII [bacterium]MDZ4247772.1 ribonuclease HII [Patescibacteria group bacterium]
MPVTIRKQPRRSKAPGRERERHWSRTDVVVCGVDEVGRGAWAGPLVAGAVILDPESRFHGIRDSKLLLKADRERIAAYVRRRAMAVGVGTVGIDEFNRLGLSRALREAGSRAVAALDAGPDRVLLDGRHDYFAGAHPCETIIKGDLTELCIAAASVVAKVHRDGLMRDLAEEYPEYGFHRNVGYGTLDHQRALREHGPCDLHRRAWAPIAKLLQPKLTV